MGHLMRQPISGTQQAISRQSRGNPEVLQEATKGFVTFLRPLARSREPCKATRGSSSKSWCTLTKTLWGEDAVVSAYASWWAHTRRDEHLHASAYREESSANNGSSSRAS